MRTLSLLAFIGVAVSASIVSAICVGGRCGIERPMFSSAPVRHYSAPVSYHAHHAAGGCAGASMGHHGSHRVWRTPVRNAAAAIHQRPRLFSGCAGTSHHLRRGGCY